MTARILVADGVATTRITLKVRLSAACYDVVTATAIDQIAGLVDEVRPDLLILGNGFPESEALHICELLSQAGAHATIPVLMLVPSRLRLAALQAGAAAALDPDIDDRMLLARVRGLLRDSEPALPVGPGLSESAPPFEGRQSPRIVLVTDNPSRSQRWRQLLSDRIEARFDIRNPEETLSAVRQGRPADLYLICADLEQRGDGLQLLSELRSRHGSRNAGFVVAIAPDRGELAAIALDLGAGDVLPDTLAGPHEIDAAAMTLRMQLARKTRGDRQRAEVHRHMIWAMTDPLTGLYNRRYALPRLSEIARDAIMRDRPFSILVMDLDHFKSINDRFGHAAGDAVLVAVSQRITDALGAEGMAARMGGEEFLAVLCSCDGPAAEAIAERLRRDVQDRPIALPSLSGGGQAQVTVSIGVATARHSDRYDWPERLARETLERADRALLAAKAAGRNRIVMFEPAHAA
ncbi:diguanylate cyclase [Paracoccus bogoriensis]|uniref:diguanylate cyclase n=1 Tax=Paracoccus bogoriensis TaxID=242065 RepID=UPI001CA4E9A8|nr:diguanylate cyclase [Paracoccus bogoriensis]MBW7055788.1 diguanylate cyclase [Paracoccus bogoriensis]